MVEANPCLIPYPQPDPFNNQQKLGATARVFATPELTELILEYAFLTCGDPLGTERLVRRYKIHHCNPGYEKEARKNRGPEFDYQKLQSQAQGMRWLLCSAGLVNRFFHSTVETSPMLQEHLFMQWRGSRRETEVPKFNPLLACTFTWGYFHSRPGPFAYHHNRFDFPNEKRILNKEDDRRALLYAEASWRKMYPVLPPIRSAEVTEEIQSGNYHEPIDGFRIYEKSRMDSWSLPLAKLPECKGLRMGMLFDTVEDWKEPRITSLFDIEWEGEPIMESLEEEERSRFQAIISNADAAYNAGNWRRVVEFADSSTRVLTSRNYVSDRALVPVQSVDRVKIRFVDELARCGEGVRRGIAYPKLQTKRKTRSLQSSQMGTNASS